jgi:hypothetical protein
MSKKDGREEISKWLLTIKKINKMSNPVSTCVNPLIALLNRSLLPSTTP